MSRFFSDKHAALDPYTPGEQPRDRKYIKLNTNESPFPASALALREAAAAAERLNLYSDPECTELVRTAAEVFGLEKNEILFTNGSDEILNFAFMAFCDENHPAVFPNITYGFYPVFAEINNLPYREIPLKEDFSIDISDYFHTGKTVFIANPNAPTGIALKRADIKRIVESNRDNIVVIDEAYVDFGAESCLPLIHEYDNLLVVQTFSKSRSMAGARLGFGAGTAELISDLRKIKYSTNPYNVNSMTMAAGIGALRDREYFERNCSLIAETRQYTADKLKILGFWVADSSANFLFVTHPDIGGEELYRKLKERGILIRHLSRPEIKDFNRITIGRREDMDTLLRTITSVLEEKKCDRRK